MVPRNSRYLKVLTKALAQKSARFDEDHDQRTKRKKSTGGQIGMQMRLDVIFCTGLCFFVEHKVCRTYGVFPLAEIFSHV